jgi:acetyl-CoA synthetase
MVHERSIGLPPGTPWQTLVDAPLEAIPSRFNLAVACVDEQPAGDLALVTSDEAGVHRFTFGDIANRTARLAAGLRDEGVTRGDRIAIVLPQRWETLVMLLATMRIGAIAVPIDPAHGPEAMSHRLADCAPRLVVVDDHSRPIVEAATNAPVIHVRDGRRSVHALIAFHQPGPAVDTPATEPAMIFYEGRREGPPAGIVLPHRALLGWLPSIELALGWFPAEGDVVWTPSPWTEPAGLLAALLPALYHGTTVVGGTVPSPNPGEDAERMRRNGVTCVVTAPDVVHSLMRSGMDLGDNGLRSVAITGFVDREVAAWIAESLGAEVVNQFAAPTHTGPCVGTAAPSWNREADNHGRPYPGYELAILGHDGDRAPDGDAGRLAVRSGHPAAAIEFWRRPELTTVYEHADWVATGVIAAHTGEGSIRLIDREPGTVDLGGRVVGAWEIERCLEADPAVARAAAVASPDTPTTDAIKAYVIPHDRANATPETAIRLAARCGERLGPHLAPKRISFVGELPLTPSGMVDHGVLTRS